MDFLFIELLTVFSELWCFQFEDFSVYFGFYLQIIVRRLCFLNCVFFSCEDCFQFICEFCILSSENCWKELLEDSFFWTVVFNKILQLCSSFRRNDLNYELFLWGIVNCVNYFYNTFSVGFFKQNLWLCGHLLLY